MNYLAEAQVTPLTNVRRERVLPVPGEILVRTGDSVEPTQIVARADLPGEFRIVPVARLLDIQVSQTKRYLRVKPGDKVEQGQVIAKRGRLFAQSVKSPIDGTVTASGGGRILIESPTTLFELSAFIDGRVTNVLAPHGLIIETTGAVIQGVWGAGGGPNGENLGFLKCMVKKPSDSMRAGSMDLSCRGVILIGGAGLSNAALEHALEIQVGGIVVGGLSPALLPQIEQLPFPVIVTEGIGAASMSEPIFELLKTHDGREASISGRSQSRWPVVRPEIIIPLPGGTSAPSHVQIGTVLTVGARVRAVRAPYMGAVGVVTALPAQARRTETGAKVHGAHVDLGQESPIFIPLVNLEVLR